MAVGCLDGLDERFEKIRSNNHNSPIKEILLLATKLRQTEVHTAAGSLGAPRPWLPPTHESDDRPNLM
jgi:hypothetical protein